MNPAKLSCRRWPVVLSLIVCWLLAAIALHAQSAATGTVQGRIYNPATQSYVGNAEVRLEVTNQVTYTEDDGSFQFNSVPVGEHTLTVNFTGYDTVNQKFTVSAGLTAVREINLTSTAVAPRKEGEVIQLAAFTVSSEREGNSKAIMDQRRDMNIKSSVSADIFGDTTDGNVGEFLKYLPGVDLDYVESEPRGPRLGGMDGQYVGVSFDGMRTANADANRGGGVNSRATSFEGFSITSIDSIEINWTASPQDDADSPAGTVNMKSKRAFDRKGRRFDYNVGTNFNSNSFTLSERIHPGEKAQYQARPNWQFAYAESFLDQKVGILLSYSRAASMTQQTSETMTYNNTPPVAIDPRPMVVQQIDYKDGPKWIRKDSLLLTADWKVTPRLVLSLNMNYSSYSGNYYSRNFTFVASNNNSNAAVANGRVSIDGDGATTIIATRVASGSTPTSKNNTVATLNWGGGSADKFMWTRQFAPRFEYKLGALAVDGAAALSKSVNEYKGLGAGFSTNDVGGVASSFIATRPNDRSWEWTIRQTSGADWFNMNSFTSTNGQLGGTSIQDRTETWTTMKWTGTLNARYPLPFLERFPTVFKMGGKWDEEDRINHNWNGMAKYVYVGPGGDTVTYNPATQTNTVTAFGNWANLGPQYISPEKFDSYSTNMMTVFNINGVQGMPPRPNKTSAADLYHAHPELFVNTGNVTDYYNSYIANERRLTQFVTGAYGQFDTRVTSKLQIRTGVRWERTKTVVTEFDPLSPTQMLSSPFASQFTRNATTGLVSPAQATSISGIIYQYTHNPRVKRSSHYDNYFPSLMAKYNILSNLEWQAGVNKGIGRPPVDNLTGIWAINDNAAPPTVTAPNPNLLPEKHLKAQTRLAYYFGGKSPGQVSVSLTQDEVKNFISSTTYTSGAPLGVTDPQYDGYYFISTQNDTTTVHRYRNMSLNYQQTLGFLSSEYLRGIGIGMTYDRSYDNQRHINLVPRRFAFTPSYTFRRLNAGVGIIWADKKPSSSTYGEYYGAVTKIDVRANYRISNYLQLYLSVRNITNVKDLYYKSAPGAQEGTRGLLRNMEQYGGNWTMGVKGAF